MFDTRIVLHGRQGRTQTEMAYSSRYGAYLPFALLVALAVATPLPLRSRCTGLGWALGAIAAFIMLRHWLLILNGLSELRVATEPDAHASRFLHDASGFVAMAPLSNVMAPIVVWLIVLANRGGDLWPKCGSGRG